MHSRLWMRNNNSYNVFAKLASKNQFQLAKEKINKTYEKMAIKLGFGFVEHRVLSL